MATARPSGSENWHRRKFSVDDYYKMDECHRVRVQNPIRLNQFIEAEPDLCVVAAQSYATRHAQPSDVKLLIEIATSSLSYNRNKKRPLYAQPDIPEVCIFDVSRQLVEIYTDPDQAQQTDRSTYLFFFGRSTTPQDRTIAINGLYLYHTRKSLVWGFLLCRLKESPR